ncbi:MAG: hypothetical protein M3Z92_07750 [Bacteroidota bacterium]|nr:hypothetical protein [Bacteroidota bacterium]
MTTGFFIAEASATEKIVTLKIKKHYLHNFEPSKSRDKILSSPMPYGTGQIVNYY